MWGGHSCPPTLTMTKKPKSAGNQSLSGIRVLVGRARHQAGALSAALRTLGAEVIEIPFIEIRKPKSFKPLDAALKSLGTYDWLVLTSVNGVEAMWERLEKIREGHDFSRAVNESTSNLALAAEGKRIRIAAIGPATKKAIERRGVKVDVVPKEYVAESVVRCLKSKVKGKRVLLVRAKVARDVIPRELRKAGALVDVVEAYETVVPQNSRRRLQAALRNPKRRPHIVTFTSSSTVRNFVALLDSREPLRTAGAVSGQECPLHTRLNGIRMASIGPVTSSTLRESGLPVDISAKEFTIPGLVGAIVRAVAVGAKSRATDWG
jgi:uroporphyrinogen-III synthase